MKEQEKSPEKEVNEMEASNLSDIEFKVEVIRMLKELSENYNSMKKDIETMKKNQSEMKNTTSYIKNSLEAIKSRLDEAEDWISDLEDKVEKNTQAEQQKEKDI